jgi:hypothetical protein
VRAVEVFLGDEGGVAPFEQAEEEVDATRHGRGPSDAGRNAAGPRGGRGRGHAWSGQRRTACGRTPPATRRSTCSSA